MAKRGNAMLYVGIGAVGLVGLALAQREKARAAQPSAPQPPEREPPRLPPPMAESPPPSYEAPLPEAQTPAREAPMPAEAPPALDPLIEPPGPPAPIDLPVHTSDPYIEPPGPPAPVDLGAPIIAQPVDVVTTPSKPSKLGPPKFTIDVQADEANYGKPASSSSSPAAAAAPKPPAKRTPKQAAQDLLDLAKQLSAAKRMSELGWKDHPNAAVKAAQLDMGGVKADGIYGQETRARGKALLGVTFPVRA